MDFTKPFPKRPVIRKLGTIACDIVETTPLVFGGRLYRFEYIRAKKQNPANDTGASYFRLVEYDTGRIVTELARGCHLGCAYADGETLYAVGVRERWGGDTLGIFRTSDLCSWEETSVRFPGYGIYNTGACKMDGGYTLLMEIDAPKDECGVPFTFRFARSDDMTHWTMTPPACVFQKERYAGGPAIYTFPGDPYYYVLYVEALPGGFYTTCAARSRDLTAWEYSPVNPLLMYGDEDKVIANPALSEAARARIAFAHDVNNSDVELCGWDGGTVLMYSWGNQHGNEFLAEARCELPPRELLRGLFYAD